jgi:hypothetical protein
VTIDFDAIRRAAAGEKPVAKKAPATPTVQETVRVTPVAGAAYLMKADMEWTWEDLRDYAVGQIVMHHGPQVRNAAKEAAIFKGFMVRYGGSAAVAIARFAFEQQRGMWQRAPISVNRFTKGSDPYFADIIAKRL